MPARQITDDDLQLLWDKFQSPAEISKVTGITVRSLTRRIRSLGVPPLPPGGQNPLHILKTQHGKIAARIDNGTVIVFSDAHYHPKIISTAHRALLKLIRDLKPRMVICNGDAFDGGTISRWPRIGWDKKPSVPDELRAVQERLTEIEDAAGRAQLCWPLGNHDARFETFLAAAAPQYEGVKGFSLKDHFPTWSPCWGVWINDDVVVKHRWRGGIHATRNNTLNGGVTMVTGHLHSLKVTPLSDYKGTRYGVDTGTLADPDGPQFSDYLEMSPTDWRSGFAVLTFHKGRLLWPELVHVLEEGVAEFRGTILEV